MPEESRAKYQIWLCDKSYLFLGTQKAGDGNRTHVSSLEG